MALPRATFLAVVATAAGALPEVLGEAAVLVPVGDVDALAGAMASVVADDDRRADLVTRGRRRVADWPWTSSKQALADLLVRIARLA